MNIAAVINVSPGQAALSRANRTQTLLLEHLGPRLGSIRLTVPRLLEFACHGALAEKPDLLVVAGDPRAARRAGQLAYAQRLPILFLPGPEVPDWASPLWGSLSLEDMVAALAGEAMTPLRLSAGLADGQIFFGSASCGFLPQIRQIRADFAEAEGLAATARVLGSTVAASSLIFGPKVVIRSDGLERNASAVVVEAQGGAALSNNAGGERGSFACAVWRQGPLAFARASLKSATGRDWRSAQEPERFCCNKVTLQTGARTWLLLDGEPLRFRGPVELRYVPNAVETFAFTVGRARAAARARTTPRLHGRSFLAAHKSWNRDQPSHVRNPGADAT